MSGEVFVAVSASIPPIDFWAAFDKIDLHPQEQACLDAARIISLEDPEVDDLVTLVRAPRGEGCRTIVVHLSAPFAELTIDLLKLGVISAGEVLALLIEGQDLGESTEVADGVHLSVSKSFREAVDKN